MKVVNNLFKLTLSGLLLSVLCACGGGSPTFDKPSDSSTGPTPIPSSSSVASSSKASVASEASKSSSSQATVASSSSSSSSSSVDAGPSGASIYAAQCASCHGAKGQGGLGGSLQVCKTTKCSDFDALVTKIDTSMPPTDPAACDAACARKVAAFIQSDILKMSSSSVASSAVVVISSSSSSSSAPAPSSSSSKSSSSAAVTSSSSSTSVSSSSAKSSIQSVSSSSVKSSSSVASSSSTKSSSSIVASSSSIKSSSSAVSSSVGFVGNAARGKDLYEKDATLQCTLCHKTDGSGISEKYKIDAAKSTYASPSAADVQLGLAAYIGKYMPATAPGSCTDQCAADIAAYIKTWVATTSSASSAATSSSSVAATSSSSKSSSSTTVIVSSSSVASSSSSKTSSSSSVSSAIVSSSSSSSSKSSSSAATSSSSSSSVDSSAIFFQEDFESTALNAQPANWDNFLGYNFNASNTTNGQYFALVDNAKAHSGSKSLHLKGGKAIITRALPANTRRVYMRAYVNMTKQMGNVQGGDAGSNHEHLMGIRGKQTDVTSEIRVGQIKGTLGTNEFGADDIAPNDSKWRSGPQMNANTWYCVETAILGDTAYNEVHMWVDGALVHSVTSVADWTHKGATASPNWIGDKFKDVMFGYYSYTEGNMSTETWIDDLVVSSKPIGCGTTSGSSSSSSSSSSSGIVGNATTGQTIYKAQCEYCHGDKLQGMGTTFPAIDPTKTAFKPGMVELSLEAYISAYMPKGTLGCTGQCAADAAAYIRTFASSSSSSSSSSSGTTSSSGSSSSVSNGSINYGPRTLRVLTRNEFVNSVNDLTAVDIKTLDATTFDTVPSDGIVGGFSNNTMTGVNSSMLQSYSLVVGKVVDKLATQNFSSIVDCTGLASEACGAKLMSDFAPKVFRRPVTDAELQVYATMFTAEYTGGDTKEGIKLALKTLFTSPQFLYRDETGVSAAEIANGSSEPQYEAKGTPVEVFNTYPVKPGYHAGNNAAFTFTGSDLLDVTAIGTKDGSGNWPTLNVDVGGKKVAILVNASYAKQYKVLVTGVTGGQYLGFASSNGGCSDCLILNSAKVSAAKKVEIFSPVVMDSDSYMLDQYQLASFLSFTFTGSTPDTTLLAAAAAGQLQTSAQVSTQVERLIATAKAKTHFGNFAAQWLRTDRVLDVIKDTTLYPKFTADVRKAMAQEVRDYYTHVVLDEGDAFTKLFDGNFTFVNAALADFYGITGVTGTNMRKVTTSSRAGLVTAGAYLASNDHNLETAPILRAVNLRRQFLCHDVPPPPTGVSLNGESVDALREKARVDWEIYLAQNNNKATSRKKYEFQTSASLCQTCHEKMINPLGGGMEDFDAVGLPQTLDYNGLQIDAVGKLIGVTSIVDGQQIDFTGTKQLAHEIAGLDVTRQCFIDNNFRLALGTSATYFDHERKTIKLSKAELDSYASEEKKLEDVMKANNNSTKALLKAIGSMDSVRYRKNVQR